MVTREWVLKSGNASRIGRATGSVRVKKTLDRLAYASLLLDICIAIITTVTFFDVKSTQALLVPMNYLLTVVVILSVTMFVVLLLFRSKERQAVKAMENSEPSQ